MLLKTTLINLDSIILLFVNLLSEKKGILKELHNPIAGSVGIKVRIIGNENYIALAFHRWKSNFILWNIKNLNVKVTY